MQKNRANIEYEKALLGYILNDGTSIDKVIRILKPEDFFDVKHKQIFQTMIAVQESGFVIERKPILSELIIKFQWRHNDAEQYLDYLIAEAGLSFNVDKYMQSIAEHSSMRILYSNFSNIQKQFLNIQSKPEDILEMLEMQIISNTRSTSISEFKTAKQIVDESLEEIRLKLTGELVSGLSTEYKDIDKIIGGLHKGDLIIIAARPSMGKTALALNIAANISKKSKVAFFSLEMPGRAIINRILGFTGLVPSHKIQDPKYMTDSDMKRFSLATEKTKKLDLYIDDTPGIKLAELVWKCKRLHNVGGLDLIVIDYLQLVIAGGDSRQAEVATISRTLKKLARELDVPLIALSQLSRKVESRESKIPMMSDIRESGAIEQDADLIAFVYRESYYQNKVDDQSSNNEPQSVQLIISKHRNGPTGVVKLMFNPEYGLFMDAVKGEY